MTDPITPSMDEQVLAYIQYDSPEPYIWEGPADFTKYPRVDLKNVTFKGDVILGQNTHLGKGVAVEGTLTIQDNRTTLENITIGALIAPPSLVYLDHVNITNDADLSKTGIEKISQCIIDAPFKAPASLGQGFASNHFGIERTTFKKACDLSLISAREHHHGDRLNLLSIRFEGEFPILPPDVNGITSATFTNPVDLSSNTQIKYLGYVHFENRVLPPKTLKKVDDCTFHQNCDLSGTQVEWLGSTTFNDKFTSPPTLKKIVRGTFKGETSLAGTTDLNINATFEAPFTAHEGIKSIVATFKQTANLSALKLKKLKGLTFEASHELPPEVEEMANVIFKTPCDFSDLQNLVSLHHIQTPELIAPHGLRTLTALSGCKKLAVPATIYDEIQENGSLSYHNNECIVTLLLMLESGETPKKGSFSFPDRQQATASGVSKVLRYTRVREDDEGYSPIGMI
jgi:hypothetical protein